MTPVCLLDKEWLTTNGLGGYASGSLLGVATRRYHGAVRSRPAVKGSTVMVPRLHDTVETDTNSYALSGVEFADGQLEGEGYRYLQGFRREWQTPVWTFDCDGSRIEKRVVMPHGQNTVHVQYTLS